MKKAISIRLTGLSGAIPHDKIFPGDRTMVPLYISKTEKKTSNTHLVEKGENLSTLTVALIYTFLIILKNTYDKSWNCPLVLRNFKIPIISIYLIVILFIFFLCIRWLPRKTTQIDVRTVNYNY